MHAYISFIILRLISDECINTFDEKLQITTLNYDANKMFLNVVISPNFFCKQKKFLLSAQGAGMLASLLPVSATIRMVPLQRRCRT